MADPRFVYDAIKRRIKDSAIGRFLLRRALHGLRDDTATTAGAQMRDLAERAVRGEITAEAFRSEFRDLVRNANGANYLLGRGGVNAMTGADFRALAEIIARQNGYAERFAADIAAGRLSPAQAGVRASMYGDAAVTAFERGRASAYGLTNMLPEYPGERCLGGPRCKCAWRIVENEESIDAYWQLGAAEHCEVCAGNAARYNPYSVPRYYAVPDQTPVRLSAIRRVA